MTFAASIAMISAGIACYVAVLSAQLARAPGWREQRFFSLAAVAVAAYALLNLPTTGQVLDDHAVVTCSRIQFALAALHTYAWLRYSSVLLGQPTSRLDRRLIPLLVALGALGALTPAFLTGAVRRDVFAPTGNVYRTAETTAAGGVAYLVVLGLLAVPAARFVRAWRRGQRNTGVQAVALGVLLCMGVNDALVAAGLLRTPYLVDVAFLAPLVAVAYALTARFVADARAHEALQRDLVRQVADRTAELGRAQEALYRAEKLAALGQFAAGVAHDVNNPAAVVTANLQFLVENEGPVLSASGREALEESQVAMGRLGGIVRQLLDAGRLAASPESRTAVALRPLVEHAFSVARARFGKRVRLVNAVREDVGALAGEGVLSQVLTNLVVNAVQAIPDQRRDGQVIVGAERDGPRVRILVDDNGAGMPPEVLRRVFEPFFTTKPFGSGHGLGLAVSRGLVASLGGDLRLESSAGEGTCAVVELQAAAAPTPRAGPARLEPPAGARLHLLLVDDEPPVLSSLRRLLEARFGIELASGVDEALGRLQVEPFDLVLCDVMMPAGGGERLYRTLLEQRPALARRLVFLTGGAVTDAARRFLHTQPQPVLLKPLDVAQLSRVAERVAASGDARPAPA
ncbi:MAG: ATP-binding protein [Anaeromyxobacter sp.]